MVISKPLLLFSVITVALISCSEENQDITDSVNKAGSIETAVHVNHIDSTNDELTTTHTIWYKHNVFKTVVYKDTIPALGTENRVAENEDGDTKNVSVPKDYEIYITVK